MRSTLNVITSVTLLASLLVLQCTPRDSYDPVLLVNSVTAQTLLMASLNAPMADRTRAMWALFAHFGFITTVAYGAVAGSRPLLSFSIAMLVFTLISRAVLDGCIFSFAENPQSQRIVHRVSSTTDWLLTGLLCIGVARFCVARYPEPSTQQIIALLTTVGVAVGWS